ncbi:antibiotic ABC transporter permease [Thiocapsa imhoffii]|uniref:Antibiotic ABC transporter permease n=1 Tax=Thiocapsa imhoffii TaxID=382777 RepID=A0A9X0WGF8_9GAMM|nr:ABC transporter permease [Thiocapsa imhoffii]MBK1644035.1 antibiotic ABC transporter permease [Thiocapsa imhoffii]
MWARIFALVIKEFLAILRDKASRMVLIGPPVIQLMVFGYAASFDLEHIPYAVLDQDGGAAARELVARFAGSPNFTEVARLTHQGQIAPLIDNREVLLVLRLDANFSRDLLATHAGNGPARVQVLIDGRNSNTASLALNDVTSILMRFNRDWAARHGQRGPPAELVVHAWFNPNLQSRWFIVPGIVALLTLVVTLLVTGLSVAREREMGTFDQLLVTPLRPHEILIGKAVPGFVIGLLEAGFIVLMAVLWFQVPFVGSPLALLLGLSLFLLAAIGIGLMISSLAVTQQQGLLGVFLFLVPAIILSGFATPIANMPEAVQALTYLNPMRYVLIIVRGVFLEGSTIRMLIPQYWPLALMALFSMGAATWLFRHRMG